MANMLLSELSPLDRSYLAALTMQPGWKILVAMFEQQCQLATTKVIQLDPNVDGYAQKLANAQINARATNDFCASVLKSVDAYIAAVGQDREAEALAVENAKKIVHSFQRETVQQ